MRTSGYVVILVLALDVTGCGSPLTPGGSTVAPTVISPPSATSPSPTVTSISPTVGSIGGETEVTIIGAALGATVTFGGAAVQGRFDSRYPGARMILYTPPHAAGTVDVVVSGQGGRLVTLTGAYTYASPQTFDFNGDWVGFGNNGQDSQILFRIRDNALLSVSCDPEAALTFSPPRPVTDSEFAFVGDGVGFSGRIVSPSTATGTIKLGLCESNAWYATKQ
jgi:hypothetical protein